MDTATQSPASEGLLSRLPGDPRQRQILVAVALSLLIFALLLGGYLMLRPNYIVLFRGLKPLDAAAVVKELEKEKIPYRYDEAANAILVPEGESKAARIKLGSADLRLQDVVGLELFKDSDLGLTEFAQKVNYQRALQGEVARTLMSLEEVDMARVHLTLPESSIFRRDQVKPKASVTIFPKGSAPLGEDSIRGIQKLVAASVPGMAPGDVIVLDQRGAAATADEIGEVSDPKFALKQAIERSYEKKISEQLARVLRETGATVSVNAEINFDQVQTTRETGVAPAAEATPRALPPLPAVAGAAAAPGAADPLPPLPASAAAPAAPVRTNRVLEQIVSAPGTVRRLSVAIVLEREQPAEVVEKVQAVVAASAGIDGKRGDVVSIVVRDPALPVAAMAAPVAALPALATPRAQPAAPAAAISAAFAAKDAALLGAAGALLLVGGVAWRALRRRGPAPRRLSDHERDQFAARLKRLLHDQGDAHVRP
ncbi:flagellar M-ring protein FliF [Lysobacter sp. yr284]|uniref:flagellar basal-body MS-ring/collar protein FliF n=1 Tax=Lysobacter sp. yr284 TaxID=1761791 RepID=UPI00089973CD|nr:flagellar basal-body MS-ring/collar protein FliF [Lysobacter sp. yr284]SDZ15960.1 flagellar M-ring protein FliF [Lysobacter sp. yr284]